MARRADGRLKSAASFPYPRRIGMRKQRLLAAPARQLTRRQVGQALAAVVGAGLPIAAEAGTADAPWLKLPPTPALPTPTRSDVAAVNGTKIFFAQFGQGEPVLLLHGGLGSSNYFGHQIPQLARHFSVIAMDTRGHGRSPVTSAAFGYRLFAEDVAALLDFLANSQGVAGGLERRGGHRTSARDDQT